MDHDDEFYSYEYHGGEATGDGPQHHHHDDGKTLQERDRELYEASMGRLKLVSFVSIFFIIC